MSIQLPEKMFPPAGTSMKKLGFGCLRLPLSDELNSVVDQKQFNRMVDTFLAAGFNYFDTAHGYLNGNSETAIREGLVKRYPREKFLLANKLTASFVKTEEDILPLFQKQLAACGVDYFDYYLMHGLNARIYKRFTDCNAFEIVKQLKDEGKIRHVAVSFHDKPAVLEQILTEHPEIEAVQIQLNYLDYDSPIIESGAVYEVCRKFRKPIFVMEPVKGGRLAQHLPEEAMRLLADLHNGSPASYAVRYAASFAGVSMVLSGMSTMEQMEENISHMRDFQPLTPGEYAVLENVRTILKDQNLISCTGCRYCMEGCPRQILVPKLIACINETRMFRELDNSSSYAYYTAKYGKASDCIGCGQCEQVCPQRLPVIKWLREIAKEYEH